ncbi:metal-dependent transcriptional regulator [Portibacter lacus]|uniref:Transcriptional regulator MntR n=1 Tax=Portibacter lacus TaxID=1099794 RepID=A0AA37SR46_9BACT|nr:metal-dependent transcriptional regulator [Portibacter lacus]GLR18482.1 iron-dependent repressor [Portibacter lacus]
MVTHTEENYLKAIYKISEKDKKPAGTNAIAKEMDTSAASVTDMLKRLSEKGFIKYQKYKGVNLSSKGSKIATNLIRKHRLWESFLVDKLDFTWDAVHDIAEQMEHIKSEVLVQKLDEYLGFPKFDPHGDPIPNADGKFTLRVQILLSLLRKNDKAVIIGVKEHDDDFLRFLNSKNLQLGSKVIIIEKNDYDKSMTVTVEGVQVMLSEKITKQIYVKKHE